MRSSTSRKSGERERLARSHAEYYRNLFERAEAELEMRPTADWLGDYGRQIDNLRAALNWAFSPSGDVEIGASLTAAAEPLWLHLSLTEECRGRVECALAALGGETEGDARRAMKLYAALGATLVYGASSALAGIGAAWIRVREIAENLDDVDYQLRALWGLWTANWANGRQRAALALAQEFCALAASRSNSNDQLIGDRLIGISEQVRGELGSARRHLEHMLAHYVRSDHKSHVIRFQSDQRVAASAFLSLILWLQGFPDQALLTAEQSVQDAVATRHTMSLSYILAHGACPIALWVGDLALAERYVGMLNDLSTSHPVARWRAFSRSHQGLIAIEHGEIATGLQLLRLGEEISSNFRFVMFAAEVGRALANLGQVDEGLSMLEKSIERAEETEERWTISELLRVKGELLRLQGAPGAAAEAEDHFRQALDWARRQGALSWELRAAVSLAQLLRDRGRAADATALLQPVYDRFTEGFDTADLRTARALLHDLGLSTASPG